MALAHREMDEQYLHDLFQGSPIAQHALVYCTISGFPKSAFLCESVLLAQPLPPTMAIIVPLGRLLAGSLETYGIENA